MSLHMSVQMSFGPYVAAWLGTRVGAADGGLDGAEEAVHVSPAILQAPAAASCLHLWYIPVPGEYTKYLWHSVAEFFRAVSVLHHSGVVLSRRFSRPANSGHETPLGRETGAATAQALHVCLHMCRRTCLLCTHAHTRARAQASTHAHKCTSFVW